MGRSFVLQRPGRDANIITDHLAFLKSLLSTLSLIYFLVFFIGKQLDKRNAIVDTFL